MPKGSGDRIGDGERIGERTCSAPLMFVQAAQQHLERQGVAARCPPTLRQDGGVDSKRCEELGGRGLAHSPDRQPLDLLEMMRRVASGGNHETDPVKDQPFEGGHDDLGRGVVEPVAVVDDEHDRLVLGCGRQEVDEPAAQLQRVGTARWVADHELHGARGAGRAARHVGSERCNYRTKAGQGERGGRRDGRHDDRPSAHPKRPGPGGTQERGFADAGLALEEQWSAATGKNVLQPSIEVREFNVATHERTSSALFGVVGLGAVVGRVGERVRHCRIIPHRRELGICLGDLGRGAVVR